MASNDELLSILSAVPDQAPEQPLSTQDEILGASRAYLAGPLFGFNDNVEAGITTGGGLWGDYTQELDQIRAEQNRYSEARPIASTGLELFSGAILNPLDKIKKLSGVLKYGTEGAVAALGDSADPTLSNAGAGALWGSVGGKGFEMIGSRLSKVGKEADRLLTSAYNVTPADLTRVAKKRGGRILKEEPLVTLLKKADETGLVSPSADMATNVNNLTTAKAALHQELIGGPEVEGILPVIDKAIIQNADQLDGLDELATIKTSKAEKWVNEVVGTERTARQKALDNEIATLQSQYNEMTGGPLEKLQKLKVGLNYEWDAAPQRQSVIKQIRSDLKDKIEEVVDDAATIGIVDPKYLGQVKVNNTKYGDLAELTDIFKRKVPRENRGDIVEDVLGGMRTSGGSGTANLAAVMTGNPGWAIAGMGLNLARRPESKAAMARGLYKVPKQAEIVGRFLEGGFSPRPITGRTAETLYDATGYGPDKGNDPGNAPKYSRNELASILDSVDFSNLNTKKKMNTDTLSKITLPKDKQGEFDPLIGKYAEQYGFDPLLIKSQIYTESGGDPTIGSSAGARGLMQLLPSTAEEEAQRLGIENPDLKDPETNLELGISYLKRLVTKYDGDLELALSAYHTGMGTIDRLLDQTNGRKLSDIHDKLGPQGQKYASGILGRLNNEG